MTERYEAWLQDPIAKQVLEGYRANQLTPEQQLSFEKLVDNVGMSLSPYTYGKLLKTITEVTGNRQSSVNLVVDFKAAVRDRDKGWGHGKDPFEAIGEETPKVKRDSPRRLFS